MFWISVIIAAYLLIGVWKSIDFMTRLEKLIIDYENGEEISDYDEGVLDKLDEINKMVPNSELIFYIALTLFWLPFQIISFIEKIMGKK